jgi:hypothetical protein
MLLELTYHEVFVLFCLTYFTQYNVLHIYSICSKWDFMLFYGWIIFHSVYIIYSFVDGHLDISWLLWIVLQKGSVRCLFNIFIFISFQYIPSYGIARLNSIKLQSFNIEKEIINQAKRTTEREKIFTNYLCDVRLISSVHKELNSEKTTWIKKWASLS